VTGYVLPVKEIFEYAKKNGSLTILDSAQSLGLIDININQINADLIAFAGHKTLYGPLGIGGFINVTNVKLNEFITGGTGSDSLNLNMPDGIETKYEAASSNIVAIAGLNEALKSLNLDDNYETEKEMTEYLINALMRLREVKLYLPQEISNHIGIVSFTVNGYSSDEIGTILDEDFDIAVRTGYHCAPYIHKYLNDEGYSGTVRVGIGKFNTKSDIDNLVKALKDIIEN
jgi:selenocysteine lyase/cysteine desulfurase